MYTRDQIAAAYVQMAMTRIDMGFDPCLLSFMFNPLLGGERSVSVQMERELERVYAKILTRVVRKPRTADPMSFPMWIICPDWPVPKRDKDHFRDLAINDGRHLHAVAFSPPFCRMRMKGTNLADHIYEEQALYSGRDKPIWRVHAEPITETPEKAIRYAVKSLERGRAGAGDVFVLPRTRSEMPERTRGEQLAAHG